MAQGNNQESLIPPHSVDAEKAVLGAILRDADNLLQVEGINQSDHFFLDAHQKIFNAILGLSAASESVDILTVAEKLRASGSDSEYLGPAYLIELTESCPVTQNVEHYANLVRHYFYLRRIIYACQSTIKGAFALDGSVEGFIGDVEKEFLAIANEHDRKGIRLANVVLEATLDEIQRKLDTGDKITGVPSGFTELDTLIGGFQRSDLVILAARPGMGKTAFALNCAFNAVRKKKSVLVFTLEMNERQLMSRILASEARIDSSRLVKGDLAEEEVDRLMEGARSIYQLHANLAIDETPSISLMELRSRCRRRHRDYGLDLIVVDYLQLMTNATGRRNDNREREISEISMGLKALAKELNVPIMALAQLNRGPDSRPDKRPKLSDLRESGSIEQDADLILLVYRDEYYNATSENAGIAEIAVAKNRHGSTKTIKLAFQPNFVAFQNLYLDAASGR